jgi:hypothetical protein
MMNAKAWGGMWLPQKKKKVNKDVHKNKKNRQKKVIREKFERK